jgi:hypothetical protein
VAGLFQPAMVDESSATPTRRRAGRRPRLLAAGAVSLAAVLGTAWLSLGGSWPWGAQERAAVVLDPDAVRVVRTPGGMLEVATLEKSEEFGWRVGRTCPLLDCTELLGSTTSHVRVTAHYTYRIPLAATWTLSLREGRYELRVPALEPAEPVAFDTRAMQVRTERTRWLSPAAAPNREAVVRHLGPELARRARQDHYLRLAEEGAAATVTEFAQRWLREQGQPPLGAELTVRFGKPGAQSH